MSEVGSLPAPQSGRNPLVTEMIMSEAENPPAFPRTCQNFSHEQTGMTLRDWFAGQALCGLVAGLSALPSRDDGSTRRAKDRFVFTEAASDAYQIADAMLAARHPTQEQG